MIARLCPALLAAAVLALGACGGNDEEGVEQAVRDFVTAAKERDSERFCGELVTQEFLEQSTNAKGDKATDACRQQLEAIEGLDLELVKIRRTEIDGDTATVTVALETQGRPQVQLLRLKKEDGDWKLTAGRGRD